MVSLDEYLNTSYEPEVEYVDGELVERNIGEWQHSQAHGNIVFALRRKYPSVKVLSEYLGSRSAAEANVRVPRKQPARNRR